MLQRKPPGRRDIKIASCNLYLSLPESILLVNLGYKYYYTKSTGHHQQVVDACPCCAVLLAELVLPLLPVVASGDRFWLSYRCLRLDSALKRRLFAASRAAICWPCASITFCLCDSARDILSCSLRSSSSIVINLQEQRRRHSQSH